MRTDQVTRSLVTSEVQGQASFAISSTHQTEIMVILRDSLYSNKILAVIREYCANAWDAHVCAGKGDTPIKVTLPTMLEPVFTVRDYGYGLSEEDVLQVYTQYGASSKRNSNEVVGALGIGSKSAFCYTDQFTVTSWHNGLKSVYIATLDSSNIGVMQKFAELPCGEDESGVQIQVAVSTQNILEFRRYAAKALAFFTPPPDMNVELDEISIVAANEYGFLTKERYSLAVMGCVSYELDLSNVIDLLPSDVTYQHFCGGLRFQIGEVEVSASRETLKYSDVTKRAIAVKYLKFTEAVTAQIELQLNDDSLPHLARRSLASEIIRTIGSWRSVLAAQWASNSITIPDTYDSAFQVLRPSIDNSPQQKFNYSSDLRFYLKERRVSIAKVDVPYSALLVVPSKDVTMESASEAFNAFLVEARIVGVPFLDFSTLPKKRGYTIPRHASYNVNYRKKCFEYLDGNWVATARVPDESDVYTILTRFKPDVTNFWFRMNDLKTSFCLLGRETPIIIGYKSTDTHPVTTCVGTAMNTWLSKLPETVTEEEAVIMQNAQVAQALVHLQSRRRVFDYLERSGGKTYVNGSPMLVLQDMYRAAKALNKVYFSVQYATLVGLFSTKKSTLTPLEEQLARVTAAYPLLEIACNSYGVTTAIHEYIRLIDQRNENLNNTLTEEKLP